MRGLWNNSVLLLVYNLSGDCDAFRAASATSRTRSCALRLESALYVEPRRSNFKTRRKRLLEKDYTRRKRSDGRRASSTSIGHQFPFLRSLKSPDAVEKWMLSLDDNESAVFGSWTSREESLFIRRLGEIGAFSSVLIYIEKYARRNAFIYTAGIAALALEENKSYSKQSLALLQEMDRFGIIPSPYTFTALFQSVPGAEKAALLATQLREKHATVAWSPPVWEAAIAACARNQQDAPHRAISCARRFFQQQQQQSSQRPTQGTYHILFGICTAARDLEGAQFFLRSLLKDYSPQKVAAPVWWAYLQVCAIVGDPSASRKAIATMTDAGSEPNVRHWTAHLKALTVAGRLNEALDCLNTLRTESAVRLDTIAVQTVLIAYARAGNYQQARQLLDHLKKGQYPDANPDEYAYNQVLASCESSDEARALIKEMRLSRRWRNGAVPPSKISYTLAIGACRKARDLDSALLFLRSAEHDDGVKPDLYMYSAVIWAAAEATDCKTALELLKEMEDQNCPPNAVSFNGAIAALASCGRADDALVLYEEMKSRKLACTRSTFFNLAVSCRAVAPAQRLVHMRRVYDAMELREYATSIGGPIIEAYIQVNGELGNFEEARRVFDSIYGKTDGSCLRAILLVCRRRDPPSWQDTLSIVNETCEDDKRPFFDSTALSTAVVTCSKADQWEEALRLLRRFGDSGASNIALNSVIASCGRGGRPDVAIEVLNDMEEYGAHPDELSFRNAIIACNQAEHAKRRSQKRQRVHPAEEHRHSFEWWECALALLQRMRENGLRPDIQCYSSAISACEAAGRWQLALGLLQTTMEETGEGELNLYCFNAAISACGKGGAWVEALEIYERMKLYGGHSLRPNIVTLSSLVLALDTAGQKELAVQIYDEGVKAKIVSPWRLTKASSGERIKALDLHKLSAAMSRAAVRSHLDSLLNAPTDPCVIIVGKGLRSVDEPVLLATVQELLESEYGMKAVVDKTNRGRLVIEEKALRSLMSRKG